MNYQLNDLQAYKSMFEFLKSYYYVMGQPKEIGSLLSDMQILDHGGPADPAMWDDWMVAIQKIMDFEKLD